MNLHDGRCLNNGDKYWTIVQYEPDWSDYDYTETKLREFSDRELVREWVVGQFPFFDEVVESRAKVFTDYEQCIKEARDRMSQFNEEDNDA